MEENEIYRKIGEILTNCIKIEDLLEFSIATYFIKSEDKKFLFFNEKIIQPLSFENKKKIFKQICIKEEVPKKQLKDILKVIEEIQKIRNKTAHSELIPNIDTGRIHLVKRFFSSENSLDLSDQFMQEFKDKVKDALAKIFSVVFNGSSS